MNLHFLKHLSLFSHLEETALQSISTHLQTHLYEKSKIVFREGEHADALYFVRDGQVKIFKSSEDGKEHILHIMPKYSIIGEVPMFEGSVYPAHCITMTNTTLFSIQRKQLLFLIQSDPKIALNMLALQAKRLKEFATKIEKLSLQNTEQKLMGHLLQQAQQHHNQLVASTEMTQQELANYLGSSRENLSRVINKLIRDKIIQKEKNKITILSLEKLNKKVSALLDKSPRKPYNTTNV